jgi:hypothetical protein
MRFPYRRLRRYWRPLVPFGQVLPYLGNLLDDPRLVAAANQHSQVDFAVPHRPRRLLGTSVHEAMLGFDVD